LPANRPRKDDCYKQVLLTTLGIFVTIRVSADIPLSSRVPADAPASIKIPAHTALLVSAASWRKRSTRVNSDSDNFWT